MKRILALAMGLMFALGAIAFAQQGEAQKKMPMKSMDKEQAKTVTMTGEVLDMYCYMDHQAMGPDHAKCAMSCIQKGLPVGFKAADGSVYLVVGKDHEPVNATMAEWAGKKSTITARVLTNGGMKALELVSIAEAK